MKWYQQFWPWFLIAFPAVAVVAGIATLVIAAYEPDGLVVSDYYKQGLAINQDMARQRAAQALGLAGEFSINSDGVVNVQLSQASVKYQQLQLRLVHPTRAHKDLDAVLERTPVGGLHGVIDVPSVGQWKVVVEPLAQDWRLVGKLSIPDRAVIKLHPG